MTDSERLQKVIEWSQMTTNQFGKSLGFKRSMNLYHVIKGEQAISVKLCATICKNYPAINYAWLLKGEGEMLVRHQEETAHVENENLTMTDKERIDSLIRQNEKMLDIIYSHSKTIENLSEKSSTHQSKKEHGLAS